MLRLNARKPAHSQGGRLNARCATSGRCYPHGTEMAGTIGGRMDNGIGVAGVAPNSRLLPIVISRVDRGLLARISTIAAGIDAAVDDGAEIINISAKWPVDSRAISEAIVAAVGGAGSRPAPGGHRLCHQPATATTPSASTSRPNTAACQGSSPRSRPICAATNCSILRAVQMRRTAEFRHLAWTSW